MKPYFLWDYDMTEKDVRKILKEGNEFSRLWLVARILESAKYEDVWKYLTLDEVLQFFPKLKLKKVIRKVWLNAFKAWGVDKNLNENSYSSTKQISR